MQDFGNIRLVGRQLTRQRSPGEEVTRMCIMVIYMRITEDRLKVHSPNGISSKSVSWCHATKVISILHGKQQMNLSDSQR